MCKNRRGFCQGAFENGISRIGHNTKGGECHHGRFPSKHSGTGHLANAIRSEMMKQRGRGSRGGSMQAPSLKTAIQSSKGNAMSNAENSALSKTCFAMPCAVNGANGGLIKIARLVTRLHVLVESRKRGCWTRGGCRVRGSLPRVLIMIQLHHPGDIRYHSQRQSEERSGLRARVVRISSPIRRMREHKRALSSAKASAAFRNAVASISVDGIDAHQQALPQPCPPGG